MSTVSPPVPIANSELLELASSIAGQTYLVKVRLPEGYESTTTRYPVLYLLDGDHAFAMATDIVQYLLYGHHIPDLIIVSAAYGSKNPPEYGGTNMRNRDLVPFPQTWTATPPGAQQFLQFYQEELIPFAESRYRIEPSDRTLFGGSLGAHFVLYALFERPGLFRRLAAVDGFDERFVDLETQFFATSRSLPAQLCLISPPGEPLADFAATLQSRGYDGLDLELILLSFDHFALPGESLTKALISLFRP